jgi:hypothetical protein
MGATHKISWSTISSFRAKGYFLNATFHVFKDYLFDKKKVQLFFDARISRSGKGRVSDFSATRVRVEGVGSPRVSEKVTQEAPTASGIREVEKSIFFGEDGIFFAKLAFSAVICGIRLHLHLTSI